MYLWLAALLMPLCVSADNEQTITINGFQVDKVVREISFEDDDVVLTYTDGTSDREDMELVTLAFTYDGQSTGISQVETTQGEAMQQVYTLQGVAVGKSLNGVAVGNTLQGLRPGIYVVNGKKVLVK